MRGRRCGALERNISYMLQIWALQNGDGFEVLVKFLSKSKTKSHLNQREIEIVRKNPRKMRGSFQLQVRFSPPHAPSDLGERPHAKSLTSVLAAWVHENLTLPFAVVGSFEFRSSGSPAPRISTTAFRYGCRRAPVARLGSDATGASPLRTRVSGECATANTRRGDSRHTM